MTATEILNEINRLPFAERNKISQSLREKAENEITQNSNLWQKLFEAGVITHIPTTISDEEDDFEPIEIAGEPISETIIRERR